MSVPLSLPDWAASSPVERRPEPLIESAPLAADWAATHCRVDPVTGESCRGYHGQWQLRRLEGRHVGFGNDGPPVAAMIRGLARQDALRRILVCGSADYGLLAMLADAIDTRPLPSITVLDLCETPLLLNRWFAERLGLTIETVRSDALAFQGEQPYDLILVHTLLGFFDDTERQRLAARWHAALAPGGRVLMSHPLAALPRPGAANGRPRQVDEAFAEDWRRNSARLQFKATSPDAFTTLFTTAGFEIEAQLAVRRPAKMAGGLPGLWRRLTGGGASRRPEGRDYAVVLARRPPT